MRCRTAIIGTILTVAPWLIASPLAAQQVVELPAEDRLLDADFEEVYRVGPRGDASDAGPPPGLGGWEAVGLAAVLAGVSLLAVPSLRVKSGAERPPTFPTGETDSAALATLAVWADQVWLSLLDRDGAYYGRLAEEGTFQRLNPKMDHEYELDVRSTLFDPSEDARWAELPSGIRIAGASISHPHILNVVDWRQEIHVSGPVDLMARYRRERSLTARRDYPRVGMRWRDVLGTPWTVQVGLGVHFFKPSADVEVALARSWRD
ncbi:MAG: hypothetical protein OXE73_07000, partial [Gammaproteobacteria bacterium]|nr:hypothetical protein [Gammaproteobacteria bacterium]